MAKKKATRTSGKAKALKAAYSAIGAAASKKITQAEAKRKVANAMKDYSVHACAVKLGSRGGKATAAKKRRPARRK
jgi:hypothetical protein